MSTSQLLGRDVLDWATLRTLKARSGLRGLARFCGHLLTILATGVLVHEARGEVTVTDNHSSQACQTL